MSVRVAIPGIWRGLAGGAAMVECEGATVLEVLQDLVQRHPRLHDRLFSPQRELRGFVHVFLNGKQVKNPATPVREGDEVLLLMAIAGG